MLRYKLFFVVGFLLLIATKVLSQDISQFGQKSNYRLSGGLQVGYQFYQSLGENNSMPRFAPNGYSINGQLNLQLGAIQVPLSVSFNNVQGSISSPFNLYGASPYYKWVKLHLGHRSLSFSPFVYAGRNFNGVGIELTPGKFRLTAFHGNLQNLLAVSDSTVSGGLVLPNYKRKITGVKAGIGKSHSYFELMGIKVNDVFDNNIESFARPQENLVLGLNGRIRFFKKLSLNVHGATSLFTNDQNARTSEDLAATTEPFKQIFTVNVATRFSFAGDASLGFQQKKYSIEIKYRRIDPFYYSMATNFLQNDIENYTVNANLRLIKNKLRVRGSYGIQRDNLSNFKSYRSNRTIGSLSANYFSGNKFQAMVNYSNYQHENSSGLAVVNDTVRILTYTHNFMANINYKWYDSKLWNSNINLNLFRNNVIDDTNFREFQNSFAGLGINVGIPLTHVQSRITLTPNFSLNQYEFATYSTRRLTGGITATKTTENKKWNLSGTAMYGSNELDNEDNGYIFNASSTVRYQINKANQLGFRLFYIDNQSITTRSFSEVRGQANYSITFK
jgi:hypothetical protein